jgi:hypothetical protein
MLSREHARFLVAPTNAVEAVKTSVLNQGGFLSELPCGYGLAQGIQRFLRVGV